MPGTTIMARVPHGVAGCALGPTPLVGWRENGSRRIIAAVSSSLEHVTSTHNPSIHKPIAMKSKLILIAFAAIAMNANAITPESEKAFVDAYKKAFEANDTKTLAAYLLTDGAAKDTVEFFSLMQTAEAGKPVTSIKLEKVSKEEAEKKSKPMEMPDGKMYKMPFLPTHQLVIEMQQKDSSGTSSSTSKLPVAEHKGRIVIPVPVPAK